MQLVVYVVRARQPQVTCPCHACSTRDMQRTCQSRVLCQSQFLPQPTVALVTASPVKPRCSERSVCVASLSGRQAVITQRRKLKDAGFNDMQADTILEVAETVGPDLVTKSDLALFKVETRIFFLLLLTIDYCAWSR